MEQPKRKQIRLQDYDYAQPNAYFITICTHKRAHLFGTIVSSDVGATLRGRPNAPHEMIVKWLYELEAKYEGLLIDRYVVMPNHIHFIVFNTGRHTGRPLPEWIDWFKTQTTNDYIRCVKRGLYPPFDKHIWQRNYYEHVIRNEQDLTEIRQYIDENPLKWREDTLYSPL